MLPLALSMLWEPVEPEQALRDRFGFPGLATVSDWVSAALHGTWGITVVDSSRVVISDHNAMVWVESDRGSLVVKWSRAGERFARLDASARLLRTLADQGVPVAAPIAAADGRARVVLQGPVVTLSVAVLPELVGDWLDVTDEAAVWAAGVCLAQLHRVLSECSDDRLSPATEVGGLKTRIERWLASGDRGLAPPASHRLRDLLAGLPELTELPQLVHNDFRAANILMQGSTVAGVLDFDEVSLGYRVNDLAHACVYLGTRFTDWRPTPRVAQRTLRAGYESVRPLGPTEERWFDVLVLWQAIQAIPSATDPAGWATVL